MTESTADESRQSLYAAALKTATNADEDAGKRVAAFARVARAICDGKERLGDVINVLRDTHSPQAVRLAALSALQSASFSVVKFTPCRPEYLVALRSLIDDPDPELRQRVLGILAREQDGFAQQRLLEGLQQPEKALVPPEKALQLLSYDIHADAYPVARKIVNDPPNPAAKREALRLLAADAASAPMFEKILRDKNELLEMRQLSASVLHSLAPKKLQAYARDIVLDETESDELKTTSLTALTQFGEETAVSEDNVLQKTVDALKDEAATQDLKDSARNFLKKYRK
ncbi:MAG: hypothetical protein KGM95_06160 [Betaproteobacteria bacterium]|nr:hypothetical protein [Betaproteobacteria bacterium]